MSWTGACCVKCGGWPGVVTRDGFDYCSKCDPLSPQKAKNRAKKARQMKKKGGRHGA